MSADDARFAWLRDRRARRRFMRASALFALGELLASSDLGAFDALALVAAELGLSSAAWQRAAATTWERDVRRIAAWLRAHLTRAGVARSGFRRLALLVDEGAPGGMTLLLTTERRRGRAREHRSRRVAVPAMLRTLVRDAPVDAAHFVPLVCVALVLRDAMARLPPARQADVAHARVAYTDGDELVLRRPRFDG